MKCIRIPAAWAAALLFYAASAVTAQTVEDWIYTADADRPIVAQIHAETHRDLVLRFAGGGEMRIPIREVRRIEYDHKPLRYDEAVALTKEGRLAEAEESWTKVLEESETRRGRAIFVQQALHHRADLRMRLGRHAEASEDLQALLRQFPRSRYFLEAHLRGVRCLLALDRWRDAIDGARDAARLARSLDLPVEERLRLELVYARALEAGKDWKAAIDAYRDLAVNAVRVPEIAERARAGEGRCHFGLGREAEARRVLTDLIAEAKVPAVLASAHNVLGDCALKRFEASGLAEPLWDALYSYLRGVVLYVPGDPEDDGIRARSLVMAGFCFEKLREAMPTRVERDKYRARAIRLYQECLDDYGQTPSARMAGARLKDLQ